MNFYVRPHVHRFNDISLFVVSGDEPRADARLDHSDPETDKTTTFQNNPSFLPHSPSRNISPLIFEEDVGNRNLSRSACSPTTQTDLHPAWDRKGQRSGSFQGFGFLPGGLGRVLEHCPWRGHGGRHVAVRRALRGMDSRQGIGVARGPGRGLVRSLRIRFRASTKMLVARRTPDLYSRD